MDGLLSSRWRNRPAKRVVRRHGADHRHDVRRAGFEERAGHVVAAGAEDRLFARIDIRQHDATHGRQRRQVLCEPRPRIRVPGRIGQDDPRELRQVTVRRRQCRQLDDGARGRPAPRPAASSAVAEAATSTTADWPTGSSGLATASSRVLTAICTSSTQNRRRSGFHKPANDAAKYGASGATVTREAWAGSTPPGARSRETVPRPPAARTRTW